jgi:hypothetical protein
MRREPMKKIIIFSIIISLLVINGLSGCTEEKNNKDNDYEILIEYDMKTISSRFGFMHPDSFEDMTDLGIFWQRPHPGPFIWGEIETSPGIYNWERCDKEVENSQRYGVNIVATIWPFADWDQSTCNSKISDSSPLIFDELGRYRQKPCDMNAYEIFIKKLVERYDGDGIDDMPGLVVPIKYWEVSNEPSMQEDWLVFFVGPAVDYFDILNSTYQNINNADESSMVLKGGMAGVMEDMTEFWDEAFNLGGSNYFDIGNIHSINSESVAVNAPEYKQYLESKEINKSFWVTEVELLSKDIEKDINEEKNANFLITSFVQAFYSGAEKIFHPGIMKISNKYENGKENTYYALKTLVNKIDYFESCEKLSEGQFKFIVNGAALYVLWGENNISEEIIGQVLLTDVSGSETILDSDELILSESPVFVEILKDYK